MSSKINDIAIMTDTFVDLVSDVSFISTFNVSRRFVWILEERIKYTLR